ncbi:hypothetical protein V8E36_000091 [Tilletia maclaganii]
MPPPARHPSGHASQQRPMPIQHTSGPKTDGCGVELKRICAAWLSASAELLLRPSAPIAQKTPSSLDIAPSRVGHALASTRSKLRHSCTLAASLPAIHNPALARVVTAAVRSIVPGAAALLSAMATSCTQSTHSLRRHSILPVPSPHSSSLSDPLRLLRPSSGAVTPRSHGTPTHYTPRTTELRKRQVRTRSNATKPRVTFHVILYSVLTPCCAFLAPRNYISTPFRTHPPLVFSSSLKRQSYCYLTLQVQAPSFLCQIDHL